MLIGLTGGIGSGKTTVAHVFETMGCAIYNSDERAKALYFNLEVKKQVIQLLGPQAYLSDNEINKNYISQSVFTNTNLLHQLNAIIHPFVKEDFINFKSKFSNEKIIIKETALLFEIGLNKELDFTILVTAPISCKIERVMKRNGLSKTEIEKRMAAQWPDEKKIPLANAVIINDSNKAILPQILKVLEQLKGDA
jgi:dephospho-CoA kinase